MDESYIKEWMESVEQRLDALEGKKPVAEPAPPPTAPRSQFPRWVYRRSPTTGEVEGMLVNTPAEMPPEGTYADSPADLDDVADAEAAKIDIEPEPTGFDPGPQIGPDDVLIDAETGAELKPVEPLVAIPDDWAEKGTGKHLKRISLAKLIAPEMADEIKTDDDAIAIIETELERRGNA